MMSKILFSTVAVLLLGATPALAADGFADHEDVQYPAQRIEFAGATCLDSTPIVTSDATYEAPHVAIYGRQSTLAEATSEDPGFGKVAPAAKEPARTAHVVAMCL